MEIYSEEMIVKIVIVACFALWLFLAYVILFYVSPTDGMPRYENPPPPNKRPNTKTSIKSFNEEKEPIDVRTKYNELMSRHKQEGWSTGDSLKGNYNPKL
jgi:hypothetical protein